MFQITVRHNGLNKYRVISGRDRAVVEAKAQAQMATWDGIWTRHVEKQNRLWTKEQKKAEAAHRTADAQEALAEREQLLVHAITVNNPINWEQQKLTSAFIKPQPQRRPTPTPLRKPLPSDSEFVPRINFWDHLFWFRRRRKERNAADRFTEALRGVALDHLYAKAIAEWEAERNKYEDARLAHNEAIDELRERHKNGDPGAVEEYCRMVLAASDYPDCFPQDYIVEFDGSTGILAVDYRLPSLADMPTLKEVKYVAIRDTYDEVRLKDSIIKALYDFVVYQVCLRTVHELFSADTIFALRSIVFNGWVNYINPATGLETRACIMSLEADRDEFLKINLASVDPKACFRALKGLGSSQLHAMAPIQPLLQLNRSDARFVASTDMASKLDEGTNIATIGWEEFEHLIREIFEREFSALGGEVKVTRASRDGGVDAVAFDPDPIRGGKIVIQAKRYTNPVDVSAVRDLYGTVMNEGATKGILVTTSNFGPDAYKFAKDKPLTLMDGSNLLFLLSKHGHKARIDLQEAKKLGLSMHR